MDRASESLPRGAEPGEVVDAPGLPPDDSRLPNRILGEVLVLGVSPEASTALITRSSAEVELGDAVQLEGAQNESGQAAEPSSSIETSKADSCQRASRLRRLLFRSHGCKAGSE